MTQHTDHTADLPDYGTAGAGVIEVDGRRVYAR
jgi:hypothetical protein